MTEPAPRIVDLVFVRDAPRAWLRGLIAGGVTLAGYAAIVIVVLGGRLSLETWSAEVAARVHAELARRDVIEMSPPPPAPPPPPPVAPVDKAPPPAPMRVARSSPRPAAPRPPAQAGRIVAREPDPSEPVDLTGNTFITGTASTYAGGSTTATGTSKTAVDAASLLGAPQAGRAPVKAAPSRARDVEIDPSNWADCPWPPEAAAEEIDEQTVVVRVVVTAEGRVESARAVTDPGHGFGAQAVDCARRGVYKPALDRDGNALRATSPPIRVHFTR